jgi:hypothetical protein
MGWEGTPWAKWAANAHVARITERDLDWARGSHHHPRSLRRSGKSEAARSWSCLRVIAQGLQPCLIFRAHPRRMKILTATPITVDGFYVLDLFLFNGEYTDLAIRMARVAGAAFGFYF